MSRNYTVIGKVTIKRENRKQIKTLDGRGVTSAPDGYILADINIAVDIEELAQHLGSKAIHNKKHSSSLVGGAIVGEAFNIRKVTE